MVREVSGAGAPSSGNAPSNDLQGLFNNLKTSADQLKAALNEGPGSSETPEELKLDEDLNSPFADLTPEEEKDMELLKSELEASGQKGPNEAVNDVNAAVSKMQDALSQLEEKIPPKDRSQSLIKNMNFALQWINNTCMTASPPDFDRALTLFNGVSRTMDVFANDINRLSH